MKTSLAILVITVLLAAVSGSGTQSNPKTYITNYSRWTIRASMYYKGCTNQESTFKDRFIRPFDWDLDVYSSLVYFVDIEIWINGFSNHYWVTVPADRNIIGYQSNHGIDIYLSEPGTLDDKASDTTGPLAIIVIPPRT